VVQQTVDIVRDDVEEKPSEDTGEIDLVVPVEPLTAAEPDAGDHADNCRRDRDADDRPKDGVPAAMLHGGRQRDEEIHDHGGALVKLLGGAEDDGHGRDHHDAAADAEHAAEHAGAQADEGYDEMIGYVH